MPIYSDPTKAPTALQRLLLEAVPPNKHGYKSIKNLAAHLGISRWSIQKWILADKIPPNRAVAVVELSEGRVSLGDFSRFIYTM